MTVAVAPATGSWLISCLYDPEQPLAAVVCLDNPVLAWLVDETGAAAPVPVVLGTVAPAVDTSPVHSPPWVVREGSSMWFVPDLVRGSAHQMFNFLTGNNGVQRQIYGDFADPVLAAEYKQWGEQNPSLVLAERPYWEAAAPAGEAADDGHAGG
jgi:hypothetical protein